MQQTTEKRTMSVSQHLTAITSEIDKVFNHVLGYVLAFSALIAFADVLGDGKIVQYIPWLFWIWVIAQGLGVEFQVFVLIRRLPHLWGVNRAMFVGNIAFIICLCVMSIFIGSIFVQHDNVGGSIEQSMSALGISHTLFIYARSALAILLVAIIAIDRALEHHEQEKATHKQVDMKRVFEEQVAILAQSFQEQAKQSQQRMDAQITQLAHIFEERLSTLVQSESAVREQMIATLSQELHSMTVTLSTVSITVEAMERQSQKLLAMPKVSTVDSTPKQTTIDTPEQRVRAVLVRHPTISVRALAKQANVAQATAERWKKIIEDEQHHSVSNGHHTADVSTLEVEAKA